MKHFVATLLLFLAVISAEAGPVLLVVAVPESAAEDVAKSEELILATYRMKASNAISVDEAFCGLHLLLDGKPWSPSSSVGQALMGGRPIRREAPRSPPTLLLSPTQVKETSAALSLVRAEDLRARYDPDLVARVCLPTKASLESDAKGLAYLLDHLSPLKAFYAKAANDGSAVLLALWFGQLPPKGAIGTAP